MTQLKLNLIKLLFSVLFLMPSFLQAQPFFPLDPLIFSPNYYPSPHVLTCFASSSCQTQSGRHCPLVKYTPQVISTCFTESSFSLCLKTQAPLLTQVQICQGSPCVCPRLSIDYYGNIHTVYEHGIAF